MPEPITDTARPLLPEHYATRSYALRLPEDGEYWRFMTSLAEYEAAARGEGGRLWQSDTPVSLTWEEANAFNAFQVEVVGNDPLEIVEVPSQPTHRFKAPEEQPASSREGFWPQIERIVRRCTETPDLFPDA